MQRVLRKRILRDLKENFLRYFALGALIALGMYMIVSVVGSAETIIAGMERSGGKHNVEDGEFGTFMALTEAEEESIVEDGLIIEKIFYMDFKHLDSSILRVYANREKINIIVLDEGRLAQKSSEIVLEKRYCAENDLNVGDVIVIAGYDFEITGIGTVPDYESVLQDMSDTVVDSERFGLAFVTNGAYTELGESDKSEKAEQYQYAYILNNSMSHEELKNKLKAIEINDMKVGKMTYFVKAEDNPRIGTAADDNVVNKLTGLVAGVIVMILFTYVISVFVIHGIEKESSVIGTLYALGAKKKELMRHYLILPILITFIAGMIGTVIGFSKFGVPLQMKEAYAYFSMPNLEIVHPTYLLIYSLIMPPIIAFVVNCAVIQKRLSAPALELIRNEPKVRKAVNINLGNMGFVRRFQIKQMIREARTGLTVVFGMLISLLIMLIGVNCYVLCMHMGKENKEDVKYNYMYTYKLPQEKIPDGGEACFAKTLKKEILGYNFNVIIMGIDEDNPYFDVSVSEGRNNLVVSSAMAQKYNLKVGDKVVLSDEDAEIDYKFQIVEIAQYSVGLYAFMNINSMRELFAEDDDYYNVVLSSNELDIEKERLYATTTKEDVNKASDIFIKMMMPMVVMMCSVSVIIFAAVMYLMLKVMIDRSSFNISLVKIFGYRMKEIRKLYLNGNFIVIAVGAAICIPIAKVVIDAIYPLLISNVACGVNLKFSWQLYMGIYVAIIALYMIINQLLVSKLKRIVPADVLKNRD